MSYNKIIFSCSPVSIKMLPQVLHSRSFISQKSVENKHRDIFPVRRTSKLSVCKKIGLRISGDFYTIPGTDIFRKMSWSMNDIYKLYSKFKFLSPKKDSE